MDAALDVVDGKWKAVILWALSQGPARFGELRRRVGPITEKVLTDHLRRMQSDGLLTRTAHPESPPRVVYTLTPLGTSLNTALEPLGDWGDQHQATITANRNHHAS
ncbi:winged helix-turn-helix transcriptional regulator [Actinokineospora sp. 24-640]